MLTTIVVCHVLMNVFFVTYKQYCSGTFLEPIYALLKAFMHPFYGVRAWCRA